MPLLEIEVDHRTFSNPHMEDGRMYAVFFMDVVKDDGQSELQGRAIFRDAEFIRIVAPGDKSNIVVREARDGDKQRFHRQYEMFKRGEKEQVVGTPLSQWPQITRAMAEEFKALGIMTVEHLADLRDDVKLKVGGAMNLSEMAKKWLAAASGRHEEIDNLQAQNADLLQRLAALEQQVNPQGAKK